VTADQPTIDTPLTRKSFRYWEQNLQDGQIWATWNRAWEFIARGLIHEERLGSRAPKNGRATEYLYKATGREPVAPASATDDTAWVKPEATSPEARTGEERFKGLDATVRDYWVWSTSDLQDNATRGALAEFLVAKAVGAENELRVGWANFDVTVPDTGTRIEVKSSGRLQSWAHRKLSTVRFTGLTGLRWDDKKGWGTEREVRADVFVFAVQVCENPEEYDALDVDQWEFYVAPAFAVRDYGTRSVSRSFLKDNAAGPLRYSELRRAITAAAEKQSRRERR
jgi:hypothetical protein